MSGHIWVRAEQRPQERRVPVTPSGVAALMEAGWRVTVEKCRTRAIPDAAFEATGCQMVATGAWQEQATDDVYVVGLKELDSQGPDLRHRHIMFGHAFKGQRDGSNLLKRFARGGGTLLDLEYLTDTGGRRVAAFGYWAGFAGAAVALLAWRAQQMGQALGPVSAYDGQEALAGAVHAALNRARPSLLVAGARGRAGSGAVSLAASLNLPITRLTVDTQAAGGIFQEVLQHEVFINCTLARPGMPIFIDRDAIAQHRKLRVIGDVSCDPNSDYNPIAVYDKASSFDEPVLNLGTARQPLDVVAIDNLPSLLPVESSTDYADQLLPHLLTLKTDPDCVWRRATAIFEANLANLSGRSD